MRVFKTKAFARFADREGIGGDDLCDAAARAEAGQVDADLGGGTIQQRIAREGRGKCGDFRTIVLFRKAGHAFFFFVYGFAKSHRENIRADELKAFRKLAASMLGLDDAALAAAVKNGTLREIECRG
ncbi:MAG: type II toxin-antitoxin system RelE/ParE family toxin [Pseudomonadota bacterium]